MSSGVDNRTHDPGFSSELLEDVGLSPYGD